MSQVPKNFVDLFPKIAAEENKDPIYWLWVYDPQEDRAYVEHNRDKHRANHIDHGELRKKFPHPGRVHGYAYRIGGGYRITDWEHRAVDDPHIVKRVREGLSQEIPQRSPTQANVIQLRATR